MAYTRAEPALTFLRPLALIKRTNQSLGSASSTPDSRLRRKHANVTGQGGSERHMVPTRLPSHTWKSRGFRAKIPAGGSFFFFFSTHTHTRTRVETLRLGRNFLECRVHERNKIFRATRLAIHFIVDIAEDVVDTDMDRL